MRGLSRNGEWGPVVECDGGDDDCFVREVGAAREEVEGVSLGVGASVCGSLNLFEFSKERGLSTFKSISESLPLKELTSGGESSPGGAVSLEKDGIEHMWVWVEFQMFWLISSSLIHTRHE